MTVKLVKLTTKSGQELVVSDGLTVIVGPNNAGKSALLREFHERLSSNRDNPLAHHKVLDSYEINFGTADEFRAWLRQNYVERPPGLYSDGNFVETSYRIGGGTALQGHQIDGFWGSQKGVGAVASAFVLYLDAANRLGLVSNVGSFNRVKDHPTSPLQRMAADRQLEAEVSDAVKRAFGDEISVNRYAISEIMLHLGGVDIPEPLPDTPESKVYQQKLAAPTIARSGGWN